MKYVGTGHSDMTKWEWGTNVQRDTLASHIGHKSRLAYMATAQNETTFRTKYNFLTVKYFYLENDSTLRSCTNERKSINNKISYNNI
jgi:splicing factor 3B subunit 5